MVKGAATRFPANGQAAAICIYRKNVTAKGENKVRFDTMSDDLQTYLESCYAFATPDMAFDLHRHHGYRVRFNDDARYPQILEIVEEVELPAPPKT